MADGRIKDLNREVTDFSNGDYIAVDGNIGSSKMAKDSLLKVTAQNAKEVLAPMIDAAANSNGAVKVSSAVQGESVSISVNVRLAIGDKVLVKCDGESGIVSQNRLNVFSQKEGVTVQHFGTAITNFGEWFEIVCNAEADTLFAGRDLAIGSGELEFFVLPKNVLFDYLNEEIKDIKDLMLGKKEIDGEDLSGATTGYYYDGSGHLVANADSAYKDVSLGSDYVGKKITISVDRFVGTIDARFYHLCDSAGNIIYSVNNGTIAREEGRKFTIPVEIFSGFILKCSWNISHPPIVGLLETIIPSIEEDVMVSVDALAAKIDGDEVIRKLDLYAFSNGYYYNDSGSLVANAESSYKEVSFTENHVGKNITIEVGSSTGTNDTRAYVLYRNGSAVQSIKNGTIKWAYGGKYTFTQKIETGDTLRCSWRTAVETPLAYYVVSSTPSIKEDIESAYIRYVANTGNDARGDGTKINPYKTIIKAVESGAETVIIAAGSYDDNILDLSKSIHDKITIKGERGTKVIFRKADSLILNDGSETTVAGYSNVYEAAVSVAPGYSGATQWLFFDGLADANTAITTSEAHPLERGQFYRCDCTKIEKVTAETLEDALAEIEASTTYKWFYDEVTHKLYFNRNAATSTYPIYRSVGSYLKTRDNQSVVISNIEFRYGVVNLEKLNVAELYNVSSKYVYGGGCFSYSDSIAIVFEHCEAAMAFTGVNGDGFNGHAIAGSDPNAKYCQAVLRECWSHDNRDDGYSDHEYAEVTLDGGLYEWNTKAGVTPSYGSHCVCKNVVSRHNYSGFYYTGTATEGNAGQMICYNCLSESNNRSALANVGGFRVDGTNNKVVLINCKSRADRNAFSCADTCLMMLYDCGYRSQVSEIYVGSGTITKIKTLIAE